MLEEEDKEKEVVVVVVVLEGSLKDIGGGEEIGDEERRWMLVKRGRAVMEVYREDGDIMVEMKEEKREK